MRTALTARARPDEAGQFAGVEVLPFGLLVFVVGVLLVANAWAVVDAKLAVVSAAREATRAYVESPPDSDPLARAENAARAAVEGAGRNPARMTITPLEADFTRCGQARFEVEYPVPLLTLPFLGGYGEGFTARARHGEIVDPYRNGLSRGASSC